MPESKCECYVGYKEPRLDDEIVRCDWCKGLLSTNAKLVDAAEKAADMIGELRNAVIVSAEILEKIKGCAQGVLDNTGLTMHPPWVIEKCDKALSHIKAEVK